MNQYSASSLKRETQHGARNFARREVIVNVSGEGIQSQGENGEQSKRNINGEMEAIHAGEKEEGRTLKWWPW